MRQLFVSVFCFSFLIQFAQVNIAGPNTTTVLANNTASGTPWNILPNGQYATLWMTTGGMSKGLILSNFNFSIPTGATIVGIEAATTYSVCGPQTNIKDTIAKLIVGSLEAGTNQASNLYIQTCFTPVVYGSSTNLWGTTLTASDVNSPNFGFVIYISAKTNTNNFGEFNYPSNYGYMKVYYNSPTGIKSQTSITSSIFCSNKILHLNFPNTEISKIEIFSLEGKQIKEFILKNSDLDLTDLNEGIYIYSITLSAGNSVRGKFNLN